MKHFLAIALMGSFSIAHAFTSIETFDCGQLGSISIKSSLRPSLGINGTLERSTSVKSTLYGNLKTQDCTELAQEWETTGNQVCYANENAVFTQEGAQGILRIKHNRMTYFSLCNQTDVAQ